MPHRLLFVLVLILIPGCILRSASCRRGDLYGLFDRIASELGGNYAEDLHCHFSKIMFTEMGEKKHLTFEDDVYGPNFEPLAEAIVSLGVAPTIICESAGTQTHDAAFMKLTYEQLRQK